MKSLNSVSAVVLSTCLLLQAAGQPSFAQQGGVKGNMPDVQSKDGLQRVIEGDWLKAAMRDYLGGIGLVTGDQRWSQVKGKLASKGHRDAMADDIFLSPFKAGGKECRESDPEQQGSQEKKILAWTKCELKATVCFDLDGLHASFRSRGIDREQILIELASDAFHEMVHHTQNCSNSPQGSDKDRALENEARQVGQYVWWTAKFSTDPTGSRPTLVWSENDLKAEGVLSTRDKKYGIAFLGYFVAAGTAISMPATRAVTGSFWKQLSDLRLTIVQNEGYIRSNQAQIEEEKQAKQNMPKLLAEREQLMQKSIELRTRLALAEAREKVAVTTQESWARATPSFFPPINEAASLGHAQQVEAALKNFTDWKSANGTSAEQLTRAVIEAAQEKATAAERVKFIEGEIATLNNRINPPVYGVGGLYGADAEQAYREAIRSAKFTRVGTSITMGVLTAVSVASLIQAARNLEKFVNEQGGGASR